jgi:hypothetical protein
MGKGIYIFSRTADESHSTKRYVKPRMATGGAIGAEAAVTRLTN